MRACADPHHRLNACFFAGGEFEKRILANEKNNVKFNFLVPSDPYHAYYKLRVRAGAHSVTRRGLGTPCIPHGCVCAAQSVLSAPMHAMPCRGNAHAAPQHRPTHACSASHACSPTHACLLSSPPCSPALQIKEFSEPSADTASKDQGAAATGAPAAPAPPATGAPASLEVPSVEVIPHALAKLEKPADEIYTVSAPEGGAGRIAT